MLSKWYALGLKYTEIKVEIPQKRSSMSKKGNEKKKKNTECNRIKKDDFHHLEYLGYCLYL